MDKASYIKNNSKWNNSTAAQGAEQAVAETAEPAVETLSGNPWDAAAAEISSQEERTLEYQAAETQSLNKEQSGRLAAEIDNIVGDIFAEMQVIDSSFGKLANYFHKQADIVTCGREPAYLSEDEQQSAVLYELCAFAASGIGKLFQSVKMEVRLRTEIYPHLREVARIKLPAVERLIEQCEIMEQNDLELLLDDISHTVTVDDLRDRKNEMFKGNIIRRFNVKLNNWRSSNFHLRYLAYWRSQLTDWNNDDFSTSYNMPDMEDVNRHLLFDILYANDLADEGKAFEQSCKDIRDDLEAVLSGRVTTFEKYLAVMVCDEGLLAAYQANCPETYALSALSDTMSEMDAVQNEFVGNQAFGDNFNLRAADNKLEEESDSRAGMIFINGILLTAILSIPIFTELSVLWSIVSTIVIAGLILWRCGVIFNGIQEKYELKQERIRMFANTCARRMAGELPQPRKISDLVNKKNTVWIGAVIGGIIGLFAPIPGGFILGAIIGAILSTSDEEVETLSDGSDWQSVETGKGNWAKVICFILLLSLGFEIYWLFIK